MLKIIFSKQAAKFISKLSSKHAKQMVVKIDQFAANQASVLSEQLQGFSALYRINSGEYRIIYRIEDNHCILVILWVGKRNDDEVYKKSQLSHVSSCKQKIKSPLLSCPTTFTSSLHRVKAPPTSPISLNTAYFEEYEMGKSILRHSSQVQRATHTTLALL